MNTRSDIIYINDIDYQIIKNSHNVMGKYQTVNVEIIKNILNNDLYFNKIRDFLLGKIDKIVLLNNKKIVATILNKVDIIYAIANYFQECSLLKKNINENEKNKFSELNDMISFNVLKKDYNNYIYSITIDNNNYSLSVNEIIKFLESDNFYNILNNDKINGIKKEYFIYIIRSFFDDKRIFSNYIISNNLIRKYEYMLNSTDLEALNKFTCTSDKLYNIISVNKELENEILKDIPKDYNELESALYIYIKMCKLFSYDEKYYVFNQQGESSIKHQDISHIMDISLDNNELVCFEFNILYCYFLNKLGINFKSNYLKCNSEEYGKGHVNVDYRFDKFLIEADAALSIISSDMYLSKVNKRLKGIKCLNKNKNTQEEFTNILNKVYKEIYEKEDIIDISNNLNIMEKLKYLYDKLKTKKLKNMDLVSYLIDLYQNIFTEEEKENKVNISLVRNIDKVNAVITLNVYHFDCFSQNIYYLLIPNDDLLPISSRNLQKMFDDGILEYINIEKGEIPGIILKNEMFKIFAKRK